MRVFPYAHTHSPAGSGKHPARSATKQEKSLPMNRRTLNRKQSMARAVRPVVIASFLALPFALIVRSQAQQAPETKDTKDTGKDTPVVPNKNPENKDKTKTPPPPPPGNPLVLRDPDNGSGNNPKHFDDNGNRKNTDSREIPDYGNYGRRLTDPRDAKHAKEDLPLFGYDFFAPSREYIQMRRSQLLRDINPDYMPTASNGKKNTSTNANSNANDRNVSRNNNTTRRTNPDDSSQPDDTTPRRNRDGSANGSNAPDNRNAPPDDRAGNASDANDTQDNITIPDNAAPYRTNRGSGDGSVPRSNRYGSTSDPNTDSGSANSNSRPQYDGNGNRTANRNSTNSRTRSRVLYDEDGNPVIVDNNGGNNSRNGGSDNGDNSNDSANAYNSVADPITQLYKNIRASVPANYTINGGDTLIVRYLTPTIAEREINVTVDPLGSINLDGNAHLVVRGMTLEQATTAIKNRMSRLYKNVDVTVQLRELRTISVTVSGEAVQPGSYIVPAVATAMNILTAAGGPTENGTLRQIEVRRQGKLVGSIDVYKFLTGREQPDIALQSGDMIIVLPHFSHVAVTGEVHKAAQFELRDGETLQDAINFAGGIKPSGVSQSVQINTLQPGAERILKTVDFVKNTDAAKTPLYDGDTVDVFSVRSVVSNKVTIEGAVTIPSDYALAPGMKVSDLIERARGPLPEAYLAHAELYRWNPNNTTTLVPIDIEKALANDPKENITLEKWDRLKLYTRQEVAFTGLRKMEVRGAVQRPGVYERSENVHVSDLLMQAGGPSPEAYWDRAVLLHQRGDGTFAYDTINLNEAFRHNPKSDVLIEDNDVLAVYNVNEANFTPEHVVSILGQVVTPGIYPRGEGMKLTDMLKLSGGFRPGAGGSVTVAHARQVMNAKNNAQTITVVVNFNNRGMCAPQDDVTLDDGDVVTVQGDGAFVNEVQKITIEGAVGKTGPIIINRKGMRLSEAIALAGGLRPEAFPEGAEYYRDPKSLVAAGQQNILSRLVGSNELINASDYKRAVAVSAAETAKAAGSASQDSSAIAGLSGAAAPNAAAAAVAQQQFSSINLATPARILQNGDLLPSGNFVVNIPEAMKHPGGDEDIILKDGDRIVIPETPTSVQVAGAINNPSGVQFVTGQRLDYYIERSGGYLKDYAKDRILVIRRGGGVLPASKVKEMRPGDLIFVPTRVLAEKISAKSNAFNDLFKTLSNTALSALVVTRLFGF